MAPRFGYGKAEKLKSRKHIEALYLEGKNFSVFPLRVTYRVCTEAHRAPVQAGVAVGKRYFKKAVDRNRIKRLLREAYRLQKAPLLEVIKNQGANLHVFFQYSGKDLPSFPEINEAMQKALQALLKKIQ